MLAIEKIRGALQSSSYPCPGGHRLDGVRGDLYDYADEMMDEMGLPEDWSYDNLAAEHPEQWKVLKEKQAQNWVDRGACSQTIEITMEYDGEYGEYSYPVASGDCVAALGMNEDEEYECSLWQRAFERWNLRKILRDAERGYCAPEITP